MEGLIVFLIIAVVIILLVCGIAAYNNKVDLDTKIKAFNSIELGDSKEKVLSYFGPCANISKLKDGREKYVWTLQKGGSQRAYFKGTGVSTSSYSGTKKVTIYFKNNVVIETNGLNLD